MRDYIPCSIPSSPSPKGAHLVGELRDKECATGKDNAKAVVRVSPVCAPHPLTRYPSSLPLPSPLSCRLNLEKHLEQFPFWADRMEQLPMYFLGFHGAEDVKSVIEVSVTTSHVTKCHHLVCDRVSPPRVCNSVPTSHVTECHRPVYD